MGKLLASLLTVTLSASTVAASPAQAEETSVFAKWDAPTVTVYNSGLGPRWEFARVLDGWSFGPVKLIRTDNQSDADIIVSRTEPYLLPNIGLAWTGVAYPVDDNGILYECKVHVRVDFNKRYRSHTLSHEMGHCLGLPHNNRLHSVMSSRDPGRPVEPTAYDRRILLEGYNG